MTFRRGASLTTAATLGYADRADLGPSAGNGFRTRWPDDLAVLQDIGLTDIRLTLDWARLQPEPGSTLDLDWVERFEQILHAADAIGLRTWACLHDGSIPRWFDNDGGFGNDETFVAWWPRWVERAADRFGDLVSGWAPFACIPSGMPDQVWADTWGILQGGPPVIAGVDVHERFSTIVNHVGRMDHLGVVLRGDWDRDASLHDGDLAAAGERWGREVRDAADLVDNPLVVGGFNPGHEDPDTAARIVTTLRATLDDAIDDGVTIEAAFMEPAIAGPESLPGLLDQDRTRSPSAAAFLD